MSKPFKAHELPVAADLSQCSLEDAIDIICKNQSKISRFQNQLHVSVEADDLCRIIDLARAYSLRLQMKRTYDWDEWSVLHAEEGICVWSGGA